MQQTPSAAETSAADLASHLDHKIGIHKIACTGADCSNEAGALICPTCQKQGLARAPFCSQTCLKRNWDSHKKMHKAKAKAIPEEDPDSPTTDPWIRTKGFQYSGSLKAVYPRIPAPMKVIPERIPRPDYATHSQGTSRQEIHAYALRTLKCLKPDDIEKMRVVCKLGREVLELAAAALKPGVTTEDIDEIVHQACIERNCYPSPLGYAKFPKSLCTSVNEVICHGIPDLRPLQDGDIVNLDISLYHNGFHSDLNATYPIGKIDADSERLIRTTRECLQAAIKICKPGVPFREIGKVIEPIAVKNGCSVNKRYNGHGTRQLFHCPPDVPHYAKNKAAHTMKSGMTFTIEPMICLGSAEDIHWPDNWTAATIDGSRSAQFEELILITDTGCEVLTRGGAEPFEGVP